MEHQLDRSHNIFLDKNLGDHFTLYEPIEAHILGERIYLIKNELDEPINYYNLKHYEDPTSGSLKGSGEDKFQRVILEAKINNRVHSRGFFIRTCGLDLTNVLLFKFYAYKAAILPGIVHENNS